MKSIIFVMLLLGLTGSVSWSTPSPFSAPADDKVQAAENKQPALPRSAGLVDYQELRKLVALPPAPTTRFDYKLEPKQWVHETRTAAVAPPAKQPGKSQSDSVNSIMTSDKLVTTDDSSVGRAELKRIKSSSDFAGWGESPRHNGVPDAQLNHVVLDSNQPLTGLGLRAVEDKKPQWDTTPDNKDWVTGRDQGWHESQPPERNHSFTHGGQTIIGVMGPGELHPGSRGQTPETGHDLHRWKQIGPASGWEDR